MPEILTNIARKIQKSVEHSFSRDERKLKYEARIAFNALDNQLQRQHIDDLGFTWRIDS